MKRYGTFTGGIDLPDEKSETINQVVAAWDSKHKNLLTPSKIPQDDSWKKLSTQQIREKIIEGSIQLHKGGCGLLTNWIDKTLQNKCRVIIANVMEQQPMVTADHRLLTDYGQEVITGLAILAHACGINEKALIVDRRRTSSYQQILSLTDRYEIKNLALAHKYPTGNEIILSKVLSGAEVPAGKTPFDIGIAIIDIATCWAVYKWMINSEKLPGRVVTVNGTNERPAGNYFIEFDTPCMDITGDVGDRAVVLNGLLTGRLCNEDSKVTPATTAILVRDDVKVSTPTACIRCGWCSWHCPARLNVAQLNDDFELGYFKHAEKSGVMSCVGCGICTYICPAKLPLMQRMKRLKGVVG